MLCVIVGADQLSMDVFGCVVMCLCRSGGEDRSQLPLGCFGVKDVGLIVRD